MRNLKLLIIMMSIITILAGCNLVIDPEPITITVKPTDETTDIVIDVIPEEEITEDETTDIIDVIPNDEAVPAYVGTWKFISRVDSCTSNHMIDFFIPEIYNDPMVEVSFVAIYSENSCSTTYIRKTGDEYDDSYYDYFEIKGTYDITKIGDNEFTLSNYAWAIFNEDGSINGNWRTDTAMTTYDVADKWFVSGNVLTIVRTYVREVDGEHIKTLTFERIEE